VVRKRKAFVLDGHVDRVPERSDPRRELSGAAVELEPVVPHVADALDPDERRRLLAWSSAYAGDEPVGAGEASKLGLRLGWDARELRKRGDWRERPVDVEEEGRLFRRIAERGQLIHRTRIRA
jgi:hypothetical protein